MILQALYEYYQRKAIEPESKIAPEGWEWKEIPFLAVIDMDGNFIRFNDTREGEGKKKRAHPYLVPSLGEKKGSGIKSSILWGNLEYIFGISTKKGQKDERLKAQKESFKEKIIAMTGDYQLIQVCKKFVNINHVDKIKRDSLWQTVLELNQNILIAIDDKGSIIPVTDSAEIKEVVNRNRAGSGIVGRCLVTGEKGDIVRLEPPIKGVKGANTMGASLIAVNNEIINDMNAGPTPAFASFMKQQGYNSPISSHASFRYTTALNYLLGRDSQNKFYIGDATVVFWTEKQSNEYNFEADFPWYFKIEKDNPDRGIKAVENLYNAPHTGRLPLDEGNRFYVLGLAPNAARICVRFWKTGTIKNFADKIKQHFDDFNIVHSPKEPEHLALNKILSATAFEYKMDNVPPNLAGAVVVSILDGTPYPQTLLQQCMRRIRAEASRKDQNGKALMNVTRCRAAILKAYINRFNRFYNRNKKEVTMALDLENKDVGYLLGRLFAVLEKAQIQSAGREGKLNTTIRDRFYGAFSTSPMSVMPILLKLKNHHISKLESGKVYFESLVGQIMDGVNAQKIPAHLTLEQQAHLAVGYYHQRQDFFKKKEEKV